MKNLFIAALLLFATAASATTSSGQLSFQSAFIDRGIVAREDATIGLDLRVEDLVFDNVFATTELITTDITSDVLKLRSDFGIGYFRQLGNLDVEASINRLDATALYGEAFNEARAEVGYTLTERVRVFGRTAYPLTAVPDDLYATIGANLLIGNDWRADVEVSGYKYAGTGVSDMQFNDVLAKLTYNVNDSIGLFGGYSYGGEDRLGADLASKALVGATVSF